jgi:hypothetical protein
LLEQTTGENADIVRRVLTSFARAAILTGDDKFGKILTALIGTTNVLPAVNKKLKELGVDIKLEEGQLKSGEIIPLKAGIEAFKNITKDANEAYEKLLRDRKDIDAQNAQNIADALSIKISAETKKSYDELKGAVQDLGKNASGVLDFTFSSDSRVKILKFLGFPQ